MTYDELNSELQNLPQTWYPALLLVMVEAAISKRVFVRGGVTRFVHSIEDKVATSPIPSPEFPAVQVGRPRDTAIDELDQWRINCNWEATNPELDAKFKIVIAYARAGKALVEPATNERSGH